MIINLKQLEWKLKGGWPYEITGMAMVPGFAEFKGITPWISAQVPGSIHHNLQNAEIIDDPFYAMNSLDCEWVENKWWVYKTEFSLTSLLLSEEDQMICTGENQNGIAALDFQGVDYDCEIYLNGSCLISHKNLFEPFRVDISGKLNRVKNVLAVVVKQVTEDQMQMGKTTETTTQKPRFGFKWDFSTRLVNMGIWKDVNLLITGPVYLEDVFCRPFVSLQSGFLIKIRSAGHAQSEPVKAGIAIRYQNHTESVNVIDLDWIENKYCGETEIPIENPKLWNPIGYGEQNLYQIEVKLFSKSKISDSLIITSGIRKVKFIDNQGTDDHALPYTLTVNDQKVYMKGINWVPLDHMYGRCSYEDYDKMLSLAAKMNVNIIRVWGGGLIEKECFYSICDRLGIMVWQDFIQSASATDFWPCIESDYMQQLEQTVCSAVKQIRNHPCRVVYTGGNELMYYGEIPVDYDNENISRINNLAELLDPDTYFLPSTPSGPIDTVDKSDEILPHDIHGGWSYMGEHEHYRIYGENRCLLHSEFGTQGMCCQTSAERFMPVSEIAVKPMSESFMWQFHGDWWCCYDRDTRLFGMIKNYSHFAAISQYMQSEGLRFIIDANHRRAFENSGVFVWQLNEPYPNISCTSVVDYYGVKKSACYAIQRAYAPQRATLFYCSLVQPYHDQMFAEVWYFQEHWAKEKNISITIRNIYGDILYQKEFVVSISNMTAVKVGVLDVIMPPLPGLVFFVTVDIQEQSETFMFAQDGDVLFKQLSDYPCKDIRVEKKSDHYLVVNDDKHACIGLLFDDENVLENGITLFPGQIKYIPVKNNCKSSFRFSKVNE